jgi:hypothetical protein
MARQAITLAKTHKGKWHLVAGPDKPIQEQLKAFRALRGTKFHPEFSLVRYQETDGTALDVALRTPEQHKKHVALRADEQAAAEEAGRAEIQDRLDNAKKLDQERADRHAADIERLNQLVPAKSKDQGSKASHNAATESPDGPKEPSKETLLLDGPSLEDWIQAGMLPGAYPPAGYAERETPGLAVYKANLTNKDFDLKLALKQLVEKAAADLANKTAAEQNQQNKAETETASQ